MASPDIQDGIDPYAVIEAFIADLAKNGAECRQPMPEYASGPRPDFIS